uniref:Leucine rich repeat and sterile alpha motif containing 1 n=1 Tax=Nothobranchius furzeri TaxID=105023 RepID=A0A8C6KIK0_NOTFU
MPLFSRKKKPSEDCRKRLEHQLCRAKEAGADDILDISGCELSEVSLSLRQQFGTGLLLVLILHTNELRVLLTKGCDISTLSTLKVLDLHDNQLTCLPEDIGKVSTLQILNVEKNHLKVLPESIGKLQLLQTLNVKGNRLSELPPSIGSLRSLRTLDVSDNKVMQLPKALAHIRTLESLTLDAAAMTFPPASVCSEGTESIQRYLCSGRVKGHNWGWRHAHTRTSFLRFILKVLVLLQELKQQEKLAFERHLEEKQKEHTQLLLMNNSHKENILISVRQEQERVELGFSQQQRAQEAERLLILEKVRQAEDNISSRIGSLLMDNNRQKKSTEFLQAMEEDRIRMEQLTTITQEEANSLRKREVAAAMQKLLSDGYAMSLLQEASDCRRQSLVSEACRSMETLDRKCERMLSLQVLDKSKAIAQILQEEEMQKAAFQALQLQKDAVHGYIRNQIKLIEGELMQLTNLEIKRRNLDSENLQEVLVEQRTALSDLLQQLLKQKDQREQELRQILVEIERNSESNQQNYWMIQYQRLLDAKPLSLRMQEAGVEMELVHLLCRLSAQHYLPVLAHHHITTEALCHMTSSDLKQVDLILCPESAQHLGPRSSNVRRKISKFLPMNGTPPRSPGTPVTPSAPVPLEGPGSSECVVCMETGPQVIFLPCGHVCCCQVCSDALQGCPLCRSSIAQRIRLFRS